MLKIYYLFLKLELEIGVIEFFLCLVAVWVKRDFVKVIVFWIDLLLVNCVSFFCCW